VCDDGFAGGGRLRRRNRAVGSERLADWEVWVRASSQSERLTKTNPGMLYINNDNPNKPISYLDSRKRRA
jgi:hypothetical protein